MHDRHVRQIARSQLLMPLNSFVPGHPENYEMKTALITDGVLRGSTRLTLI
jgi:hypothetical protein